MRICSKIIIAIAVSTLAGTAAAQEKKKSGTDNNSPAKAVSASTGYPPCRGLLFLGSYCVRKDGKVCTVGEGGGTGVALRDCR
jgi:hypothetical protein